MPPKSPYKFTTPQVEFLKSRLGAYMKAFDNEDSVNAIPQFVETTSAEFRNEFKPEDKHKKAITKSVDIWFNYKAQRIEKKRMLSVELRVRGIDMFREEKWESVIRPAVVKTLGHENNRDKEWIGTVGKVMGILYRALSEDERKRYEKEAKAANGKNGSREHKIAFADHFFKKKLKKFISDLAGLCEARIMVWTIRETLGGKEKLVSIIEDDTGPKFMHEKHPDDLNDVNWYGGEWLDWMEKLSPSTDPRPARNVRDYFLTVGPSGEMQLPPPETHGTGSNWAAPIAQLFQIAWGRANGLTKQLIPMYKHFASDPEKYLDVKTYLPPNELLNQDFVWKKPSSMPAQQLLAMAKHLYDRQVRKNNGEKIEVLAFYPINKKKRSSTNNSASDGEERMDESARPTVRRTKKKAQAGNRNPGIRADLSEDEGGTAAAITNRNIVFEKGSPGAAGTYWKHRIAFLKSLCQSAEYMRLVCWLQDHQKRSSLSPPDGWNSELPWSRWTYTSHWLPSDMYEDEVGFESIQAYVKHWGDNLATLSQSRSHLEHLVLTIGMVSRDIFEFQFSNQDPDDVDHCPSYCHNKWFNIEYHETLMKFIGTVHEKAQMLFEAQGSREQPGLGSAPATTPTESIHEASAGGSQQPEVEATQNVAKGKRKGGKDPKASQAASKKHPKPRQPPRKGKAKAKGKPTSPDGLISGNTSAQRLSDRHAIHSGSGEGSTNNTATATDRAAQAPLEKGHVKKHRTKSGGVNELEDNGRPTAVHTREASPGDTGLGRKSGRIREKGPTTYTAKGEIIRGGKRVNEEIHQQTLAKRARYVG